MDASVDRAAEYAGLVLAPVTMARLGRLEDWLREEAIPAGAMGPEEGSRLASRHVADSLVMARGWSALPPGRAADLGSGAGLPGLPLAIALSEWEVLLVERSARRCQLLRRGVRVLGISNAEVVEGDFKRVRRSVEVVVSRAVAPIAALAPVARAWLQPKGIAVFAVAAAVNPEPGMEAIDVPVGILDRTARLLIMRKE
jgi:16S rRNA (guanine527-N7)-methyltransferase